MTMINYRHFPGLAPADRDDFKRSLVPVFGKKAPKVFVKRKPIRTTNYKNISLKRTALIMAAIEAVTGYSIDDLRKHDRKSPLKDIRKIATLALYDPKVCTLNTIGIILDRDHTSIMYSICAAKDLISTEKEYNLIYEKIKAYIP
jgi:chromosomal replication initiation ATPase DnaA